MKIVFILITLYCLQQISISLEDVDIALRLLCYLEADKQGSIEKTCKAGVWCLRQEPLCGNVLKMTPGEQLLCYENDELKAIDLIAKEEYDNVCCNRDKYSEEVRICSGCYYYDCNTNDVIKTPRTRYCFDAPSGDKFCLRMPAESVSHYSKDYGQPVTGNTAGFIDLSDPDAVIPTPDPRYYARLPRQHKQIYEIKNINNDDNNINNNVDNNLLIFGIELFAFGFIGSLLLLSIIIGVIYCLCNNKTGIKNQSNKYSKVAYNSTDSESQLVN